jgi:hypothetical protein
MIRVRSLIFVAMLAASACTLDRSGIAIDGSLPRDGSPPRDGGTTSCSAADNHCESELAFTCGASGTLRSMDCAASSAYCMNATCVPWLCMPSSTACSADFSSVLTCDARGATQTSTTCPFGCDWTTQACLGDIPCAVAVAGTVTPDDTRILDLCGAGNDQNWITQSNDGCFGGDVNGEDVIVRLQILQAGIFSIDLTDADPARTIDPAIYLRTICNDPLTQFNCEDDITSSDKNAHMDVALAAGTYFMVIDSFASGSTGCGMVQLAIRAF